MNRIKILASASLICLSSLSSNSLAQVSEAQIQLYQQIAQEQGGDLDQLYNELQTAQQKQAKDAWTLFYLGATETLVGRDAWMPWNKLSYTENGLARMNKALKLIGEKEQLQYYHYLPKSLYMQANAAATFTQVPDMFNTFEQGYQLFQNIIKQEAFIQAPAEATTWVYYQAIKAALKAKDRPQAELWDQHLQAKQVNDSFSQKAAALMNED